MLAPLPPPPSVPPGSPATAARRNRVRVRGQQRATHCGLPCPPRPWNPSSCRKRTAPCPGGCTRPVHEAKTRKQTHPRGGDQYSRLRHAAIPLTAASSTGVQRARSVARIAICWANQKRGSCRWIRESNSTGQVLKHGWSCCASHLNLGLHPHGNPGGFAHQQCAIPAPPRLVLGTLAARRLPIPWSWATGLQTLARRGAGRGWTVFARRCFRRRRRSAAAAAP